MPPKAKFTREEIISAALELTREQGIEAVTAREVGKSLGTSSSPIFSAFENMDELLYEVRNAALKEYQEFICDAVNYTPAFKRFGMRMIEFARTQPNLFNVITNDNNETETYAEMIMAMPASDFCVQAIKEQAELSEEQAKLLFRQVLLTGLGICYLVANKRCTFSDEALTEHLGLAYAGSLMAIKYGDKSKYTVQPNKK